MSEIDVTKCVFYGKTMSPLHNCTMYSEYLYSCEGCNCYFKQLHRYKQAIEEIKELATVNSMTTCWTFLNACDTCDKEEANVQCPQAKLEEIFKKCEDLND